MLTQTRVQAGDSPLLRSASFLDGIGHHDTDRFESSKDMSVDQCTPGALVAEVIIASRRLLRRTFLELVLTALRWRYLKSNGSAGLAPPRGTSHV